MMIRLNYIVLFNLILCIPFAAQAQETLVLEDAIQEGLENNYAIRIARNQEQIADNTNNPGNAGMLPRVSATGTFNYTNNNTRLEFFSGESQVRPSAGNISFRSGLAMDWTAFDGFRMFATKDRLELQATRSRTFTQSAMQDLVTQIQTAYFGLVRLRQQIDITEQAIQLNTAIKDLAEAKLKIGTGTSLDVLQTSTRLNADSSALVNLQDQLAQAKIGLNRLLNRDPATNFLVPSEVPPSILPTLEELTELALRQNFQIKLLNIDEQIALTQIKEVRSELYPAVNILAGYDFNWSRAEAGFLVSNRSFGPSIGINTTYNLFPGRNLKKDIANAELIQKNIQLDKLDLEANIKADLALLYQQYQALGNLLQVESRSLATAEKNTALAEELYRSGRATSFEVREAILEETRVRDRLSDVQFRKKLAEIQLKSVAGIPLY
jgi:outer membrane protein TolC